MPHKKTLVARKKSHARKNLRKTRKARKMKGG